VKNRREDEVRTILSQGPYAGDGQWARASSQLEALDLIAQCGWLFLVKVDGVRPDTRFTVMLRRPDVESIGYRSDGPALEPLLGAAIAFFLEDPA